MRLIHLMTEAFFPKHCVACGAWSTLFCETCFNQITYLSEQYCPECGRVSLSGGAHPFCQKPLGLNGLLSVCYYQGSVRPLLNKFKYKPWVTQLRPILAKILRRFFVGEEDYFDKKTILTAVPLHYLRQNERGFNQAQVLAEILTELWELPTNFAVLTRTKLAVPQVKLKKGQRAQNIRGVFEASSRAQVENKSFVVVDDVCTTAATLTECAKTLKQKGASSVWAITFARD